jgi:hypothetical protein
VENVKISLPDAVFKKLIARAAAEQKPLDQRLSDLLCTEAMDDDTSSQFFLAIATEFSRNMEARKWRRDEAYLGRGR